MLSYHNIHPTAIRSNLRTNYTSLHYTSLHFPTLHYPNMVYAKKIITLLMMSALVSNQWVFAQVSSLYTIVYWNRTDGIHYLVRRFLTYRLPTIIFRSVSWYCTLQKGSKKSGKVGKGKGTKAPTTKGKGKGTKAPTTKGKGKGNKSPIMAGPTVSPSDSPSDSPTDSPSVMPKR